MLDDVAHRVAIAACVLGGMERDVGLALDVDRAERAAEVATPARHIAVCRRERGG